MQHDIKTARSMRKAVIGLRAGLSAVAVVTKLAAQLQNMLSNQLQKMAFLAEMRDDDRPAFSNSSPFCDLEKSAQCASERDG